MKLKLQIVNLEPAVKETEKGQEKAINVVFAAALMPEEFSALQKKIKGIWGIEAEIK